MPIAVLGLVAAVIGIIGSFPQVVRLMRASHADGVSFASAVLGLLSTATWLTYGVTLGDPTQIVANVPTLVAAMMLVALIVRRAGAPVGRAVAGILGWGAAIGLVFLLGGVAAVGTAAAAVSIVRQVPQVRLAFSGAPLDGLSPTTYLFAITSGSLWTAYGLALGLVPVWANALIAVVLSAAVLARRCPPRRVIAALDAGRWGSPGRLLVRPVVARVATA
ncbi:SemiSWEET family transporter [Micromonospora pattaloongensis]|uniref:SemiSWEET family transporter n=1 Tax=Micromonospora pattaloongensis TaxID=405436 RepID=UPI001587546F|nr:SemiSWEET family transporter [Micromonospora pattaloongensis]